MWLNAVDDWPIRRTKKYPISTSTPAARPLSPQYRARSGSRCSGDRSRAERPPPSGVLMVAPTSARLAERCSVAGQRLELRLVLGQQPGRQRGVGQLRQDLLTRAEAVGQEL